MTMTMTRPKLKPKPMVRLSLPQRRRPRPREGGGGSAEVSHRHRAEVAGRHVAKVIEWVRTEVDRDGHVAHALLRLARGFGLAHPVAHVVPLRAFACRRGGGGDGGEATRALLRGRRWGVVHHRNELHFVRRRSHRGWAVNHRAPVIRDALEIGAQDELR